MLLISGTAALEWMNTSMRRKIAATVVLLLGSAFYLISTLVLKWDQSIGFIGFITLYLIAYNIAFTSGK